MTGSRQALADLVAGRGSMPIVAAPMAGGPSRPELVAAVTDAGGFAFLAGGYQTAEALRSDIARTEALTSGGFGVNLFVPGPGLVDEAALSRYLVEIAPDAARLGVEVGMAVADDDDYDAKVEVLCADPVAVVSFTFGAPELDVVGRLHRVGSRIVVTVTNAEEARSAADAGADMVCVQGAEAGGHQASFTNDAAALTPMGLLEVLAQVREVVTLPLIAAGGLMTGTQIAEVLAAGAVAGQVGTAFLRAPEAGTNPTHRAALANPRFTTTALTRAFTGRPARGVQNQFMVDHPDAPAAYPQIHHATRAMRRAAADRGDPDRLHLWAGTGFHQARAEPAARIVSRLGHEWQTAAAERRHKAGR